MLDRNKRIKEKPQRFQEEIEEFDVVISLDERVYDQIVEDFLNKRAKSYKQVHVINMDIEDNHEEATIGAFVVCELAKLIQDAEDIDDDMDELLQEFEETTKRTILHSVFFY